MSQTMTETQTVSPATDRRMLLRATDSESARRHRRTQLTPEQQELAARYIPMAQTLSAPLKRDWPSAREDFESAAMLALVEAAQVFDPTREIKFGTFARFRIIGALRDVHRDMLERSGWSPDQTEIPAIASLVPTMEEHGHVLGIQDQHEAGRDLELTEAAEAILRRLPKRHAEACRLLYIEGLNQEEAARRLGYSKSRLSYLHREAIVFLANSCGVTPRFAQPSEN
jgi:RNA polymerase sigma factor (sigma-70 family)